MVKRMTEKHTDLSPPKGVLGIPNDFIIGEAARGGDCFFDSVAQGMNQLSVSGGPFNVKSLRQACFDYAEHNPGAICESRSCKTWRQAFEEDAVAGRYATSNRCERTHFSVYMTYIGLTAAENSNVVVTVWGRPEVEGRMLCEKYGIKLHLIERLGANGQDIIDHQLVDISGSRSIDENASLYNEPQMIHILNEGHGHFVPILRKASGPRKSVEKEAQLSSSEGVQSQINPTDGLELRPVKSVAASLQQVSQLSAQPEHLEHGTEKGVSASEAKTYQAIDGRYLKECSLNDNDTWRSITTKRKNGDFKILRIRNSPTVKAALDFMQQKEFYETFNQASHWFFVVIQVDDCSESPSDALERLAKVLDEQKPVIIQWDLMCSAEHLVFYKQSGEHAFTPLQMSSASLFATEDELIAQLSKEGSFQLPLLLNALKLGIGGQFKGDVLDLLKVSFDVKREIDGWRLIDYAAWNDDGLSLRFLLLVDWDLAHKNGEGRRTLDIAAEYGGPQSISALLNLRITSYTGELFLSSKERELLTLMNDSSDSPLLIAAVIGRPETLQFLIQCGADIHCHRPGNEKDTAIALAWNRNCYENVQVLLEADSPFPENVDLNGLEESKNATALMMQVKERQDFHQSIKDGSQNVVKACIKRHPQLKRAYDPRNQSALLTALEAGQYEIYALLQSEGFSAGKNEDLPEMIEGLISEQKYRLKQAKLKYFGKHDDSHITYLLSKSRLGFGQENRKDFGFILELYKQLDVIPEISTILKVVEHSDMTEIVFDFNRDSIIDLDPTQSSNTRGACDYRAGRIYVGAKEPTTLLGTLAHELTHLAMQVCYDNGCNPYEALDEQTKCVFDKIVAQYHDKTAIDPIIQRVFTVYEETSWPAELIARVPHLLARYGGEQSKQLLTQASELFDFYEQQTQKDLRSFIKNPACVKARHQIRHLNKLLGKVDEIEQSKICLKNECLLNDDVLNCQTIQILSSPLPRLTILNLYQVLRRKQLSVSDIKGGYIFVSADQFENQEKAEAIYKAFHSVTYPTLIIDCSCEYEKSETDLWSTLNSFRGKRRIIFIAIPDVAQSLECKLKEHQAKIGHDTEYGWCDLTPASKNELLKNTVCFQGRNMSLSELISADSPVTKFLLLPDLLAGKTLEIGKHVLTSTADGYIENCYIDRTFIHQVAFKQYIFEEYGFPDILATSEQEFKKCCHDNPKRNVHWLQNDESGKLIWQQSQGSLSALREYIDTENPQVYPPQDLDKFLQQAQSQKVMLIADTAGMGKTTVLTHLAKQIIQKYPTYWVMRIDLNCHIDALKDQVKQKIGTDEFLSKKLLKFCSPFEKELFKHCLQGDGKKIKVVLMFDGFDEISHNYKETVIDLLQAVNPLNQPGIEQLWVTTRPHLREVLEDHLQQLCYTLEPFSKDDQVGILTTFWCQALKLEEGNQQQLKIYATTLIEKLAQSIGDKEKEFTGVPLQTRMLAEAFEKEVQTFCLSSKSEPELPEQLCLVDLYRKFIKNKLNIFLGEGEIAKEQHSDSEIDNGSITKNHQKRALEILFPEREDSILNLQESKLLLREQIARIGMVQYVNDKPHFIHHTFAEYYVADFLVTQLTEDNNSWSEAQHLLLSKILLEKHYQVIRFFLDELLVNSEASEVNLTQYGKQICNIWKVEQYQLPSVELTTVLFQAAHEDRAHIIGVLISSLKAAKHSDTINNLLLQKDSNRQTAWHLAAQSGHVKTLRRLWDWAREVQLNLKDDLLLAEDEDGQTAWHVAAQNSKKEILEALWGWAREVQLNLKDDMLLAKDKYGQTAWHKAASHGYKEILEALWGWAREVQVNLKDDLLLAKYSDGRTAWNIAAQWGRKDMLETLWGWGREVQLNLKDDLLLARDKYGQTAWSTAARRGDKEILETLWGWGREVQLNLKDDLLLAKDERGQTAWNIAAWDGRKDILETLWGCAREGQLNLKDDLLLAKGRDGETAWHMAAWCGKKEILETLLGWAREVQLNLKDDLFLAKDRNGETAWHIAAWRRNKEILETLWGWAREVELNLKDDLLLAKCKYGQTSWHLAARHGGKEVLETLWGWAREVELNLKDDLLLAKDGKYGQTAWHMAACHGGKEVLETLWGWAREVELNLKDDLLLAKDEDGQTAWHIAALYGKEEILEALWGCAREVHLNLKDDLLLAKDKDGKTAWNIAARRGNGEVLETLWWLAREVQLNLKDDLLLAKDEDGDTAWHIAARRGNGEVLETLWCLSMEVRLNRTCELVLGEDKFGQTAWHAAAYWGNKKILETLWDLVGVVESFGRYDLLLAQDKNGKTALHIAADIGNKEILETLWGWAIEMELYNDYDLMLLEDKDGQSVWHIAREWDFV